MLSIIQIRGDGTYYTSLGRDDYYLNPGEPRGVWLGGGAEAIGLTGTVEDLTYRRVLAGFSPDGETPLVRNAGTEIRRPGWDLTFSAPKSVSEVWAASHGIPELERAIREAQWAAVRRVVQYLEEVAAFGREGIGGHERVPLRLVAAGFEHATSRNLDPQLHIHVVLVNTGITLDGEARTIVSKLIYRHKMAAGALYRAEFGSQLRQRLGFELEAKSTWFEVAGVPETLISAHSTRRQEIVEGLAASGFCSAKAAKIVARDTREAKLVVSREELFRRWGQTAAEHRFGLEQVRALMHPDRTQVPVNVPSEHVTRSIGQLLDRQSFFSERELVRGLAEKTQALGVPVDGILSSARQALGKLVPLGEFAGERQFTNQATLDLERDLVANAIAGLEDVSQTLSDATVKTVLAQYTLSAEQEAALCRIAQRPGTVQVIHGLAGTGKSTLLAAARQAYELEGYHLIGCSLSGKASEGLQQASGISSHTIARLLHQWGKELSEVPRLNAKTILVIDEAAMVGTRRLAELMAYAERAKSRVILVGDSKQLPAIEAGAPFKNLGRFLGMANLTDIRRQFEQWGRDLVRQFADGDVSEGVEILRRRGLLHVAVTPEAATSALLSEWAKETELPKTLILAGTHEEVNWLNREAQALRRKSGQLGNQSFTIGERDFFPGDRVIFGRNDRKLGVKNGTFGTFVEERQGSAVVQLDHGGKRVFVPLSHEHMRLGYAVTTHKSQGATVNRAFVLFSDVMQSRESTYVQISRAREFTKLFLTQEQAGDDELRDAVRAMERSQAKLNATELADSGLSQVTELRPRQQRTPGLSLAA